jgi:hypothetical protein
MNVQKLLLKSLLLALVFGPGIAFSNSLLWTRVTHRYEPPLSGEEMRNWKGSVSELQAKLSKREVPYTPHGVSQRLPGPAFLLDLSREE